MTDYADRALAPIQESLPLAVAGSAADRAAAAHVFADYRSRRATETVRRQDADLDLFARYLAAAGIVAGELTTNAESWRGVTWGLVAGFVQWQLGQGYAVGSINVRLSTVKAYAKLAAQAGALDPAAYALIKTVAGYRHAEGRRIDQKRETTRKDGSKKAEPTSIGRDQAFTLTTTGAPLDRLLMALLLEHGLRAGEVAALTPACFDLARGTLTFYRQKVDKTQTHRLTPATQAAARAVLQTAALDAPLFGVDRTIRTRVKQLGAAHGLSISPHDCRHAWATFATQAGTPIKSLQDAGGWSSPAMPLRYAESAAIANDGVTLD